MKKKMGNINKMAILYMIRFEVPEEAWWCNGKSRDSSNPLNWIRNRTVNS